MSNPDNPDNIKEYKFVCDICSFNTNHKSRYNEHIKTMKHRQLINPETKSSLTQIPNPQALFETTSKNYFCKICEKGFIDKSGLWRHNKKCNSNTKNILINEIKDTIMNDIINTTKNNEEQIKYQTLQLKYYELKMFLISNKEKINQNGLEIPKELLE